MVMAGTEGVSGTADESLPSKLQWLQQRREALEEKLVQKNNELKTLCIEEAELTGVLPPEIPLEPGESPPIFRKRTVTSFSHPQNVINKLKSNEAEESALELERQVQVGIAEASLIILNDSTESKTVRRKHRLIYQQSQQRLQEVDARLNFIRQSNGGIPRRILSVHSSVHGSQSQLLSNAKHRTKKPRPPLENTGSTSSPKLEGRVLLQDQSGINLSPIAPEHSYHFASPEFQDFGGHSYSQTGSANSLAHNCATYPNASPVDHHRHSSTKFIEHDHNINNNIYILPDQYRSRTYSQGGSSSSPRSQTHYTEFERPHRPVPNTYTEEERQMHYRKMQLQKQESQELQNQHHPEFRYLDNDVHQRTTQIQYYETDLNNPRYSMQSHDYPVQFKSHQSSTQRQQRDVENVIEGPIERRNQRVIDPYVPPGYWKRVRDEIVWCPDEQVTDRFPTGSLDRRKQNLQHSTNPEIQMRYHTVSISNKNTSPIQQRQYSPQAAVQPLDQVSPGRCLLRTQSLGSVETWHLNNESLDERESTDDNRSKCSKEKEWYETSLDARASPNLSSNSRAVRRASQHNPTAPTRERVLSGREPVRSNSIPTNRRERHVRETVPSTDEPPRSQYPQSRHKEAPRVLEIPAESKMQDNGNEQILNSPTGRTVVQPGKYQPYREVTKPFEMSDFYKYSTKFRKRAEMMANSEQRQPASGTNIQLRLQNEQGMQSAPMQKRIHQPIQRNGCPSYALR